MSVIGVALRQAHTQEGDFDRSHVRCASLSRCSAPTPKKKKVPRGHPSGSPCMGCAPSTPAMTEAAGAWHENATSLLDARAMGVRLGLNPQGICKVGRLSTVGLALRQARYENRAFWRNPTDPERTPRVETRGIRVVWWA
jgi:hypothetical protein